MAVTSASLDTVVSSPLLVITLTVYLVPTVSPETVASVLLPASALVQFLPSAVYSTVYESASSTADHSIAITPLPLLYTEPIVVVPNGST